MKNGESRRDFLKKMGLGALAVGVGGIEATLSSGCATQNMDLKNDEVLKQLDKFNQEIEDPHDYLKYLQEREFVIDNDVFDAYATTVAKKSNIFQTAVGGYLSQNYLDKASEVTEFKRKLTKLELSDEEVKFYNSLFTSKDLIIFRESIIKDKYFLKALPHERFHKKMKELGKEDHQSLQKAAKDIMDREDEKGRRFVRERTYYGKGGTGFYIISAKTNWEEFYTYMAQGEFEENVEEALKKDYTREYQIFLKLKEQCKLEEK